MWSYISSVFPVSKGLTFTMYLWLTELVVNNHLFFLIILSSMMNKNLLGRREIFSCCCWVSLLLLTFLLHSINWLSLSCVFLATSLLLVREISISSVWVNFFIAILWLPLILTEQHLYFHQKFSLYRGQMAGCIQFSQMWWF